MVLCLRVYFILYGIYIQMRDACTRKDLAFWYVTKTKVELNQDFRRFLLNYKYTATTKNCKKFPRVAKSWHPVI